jgi:hypothetical protein
MRISGMLIAVGLLVTHVAGPLSAQAPADYVIGP